MESGTIWVSIASYAAGVITMTILVVQIQKAERAYEVHPVTARRINSQINPMARLHQIKASAAHHRDTIDALAEECVDIIFDEAEDPTEDERDIARSIVEHDCDIQRVLTELF